MWEKKSDILLGNLSDMDSYAELKGNVVDNFCITIYSDRFLHQNKVNCIYINKQIVDRQLYVTAGKSPLCNLGH